MSKRTDTFLFVLIQKISSVGVQTGVVLYGCVTLLMTSFDVQQHHGAARHFTSVSAIAQEQIFPNWDMPANCWWWGENLVEFGRIDLEAERLNRGVLKRKTDLRGGPFIWIWCRTRNRRLLLSCWYKSDLFGLVRNVPSFVPSVPFAAKKESNPGIGRWGEKRDAYPGPFQYVLSLVFAVSAVVYPLSNKLFSG